MGSRGPAISCNSGTAQYDNNTEQQYKKIQRNKTRGSNEARINTRCQIIKKLNS